MGRKESNQTNKQEMTLATLLQMVHQYLSVEECVFSFTNNKGHMLMDYLKLIPMLIKYDLQSQPSFGLVNCEK